MVGDAQATRQRLLEAASREFAAYGIAGARVDRIAAAAKSNKAQIYHYFESKDGLFDAVFNALVADAVREVPLDVDDLPGYAGRLFDGYEAHPEVARLATWYRLERAGSQAPLESIIASNRHKVERIEQAQREGLLTTRYKAVDLLALVVHLASLWTATTPEFTTLVAGHSRADRRKIVTDAVAALLTP
ncbi:TetR family transcriptional regulator [Micromonospora sp. NPDC050397]|uniref:TetR family transcriptional regulator n=1 Tax=Micromonospora sp. NPDC050397 TaxID=3364279 RepID=UPI00384D0012